MTHTVIVALLAGAAGLVVCAAAAPETSLGNQYLTLRIYLPDAMTGYYRGTRFDWAGVIADLEYAGHNFYPQWFQRVDPAVHDFAYVGSDIVAGPCTGITGPAEEFTTGGKALGFDEAKAGGTFLKIGVGMLRKPDDRAYDIFRLYPIADGGTWNVQTRPDAVEFVQELHDRASGYGYEYHKTISLLRGKPGLSLGHTLRNTGKRVIQTSVYNHNFLYLDRQPPGPDLSIRLPFDVKATSPLTDSLAMIDGRQIRFAKPFAAEDRVFFEIRGFGKTPSDYDIRVESEKQAVGVRVTADRPLARLVLWGIRAPMSVEPFIDMTLQPGAEFSWNISYEFYKNSGN